MSAAFVDRQQVSRRFSKVAKRYGDGDFFAREVDRRMLERLDYVKIEPQRILDLGGSAGLGWASSPARLAWRLTPQIYP